MQVPVVALGADGCRHGWAVVSVDPVAGLPAGERLAIDDALDAAVAAWTAHGAALGERLRSYPERPRQHERGRPVAIWVREDKD